MKLPEQIYVWDEFDGPERRSLNILEDGARPVPEEGEVKRVGLYKLVHEVDLRISVAETQVREPDATDGWLPSS
jgi:hypothetical protein